MARNRAIPFRAWVTRVSECNRDRVSEEWEEPFSFGGGEDQRKTPIQSQVDLPAVHGRCTQERDLPTLDYHIMRFERANEAQLRPQLRKLGIGHSFEVLLCVRTSLFARVSGAQFCQLT